MLHAIRRLYMIAYLLGTKRTGACLILMMVVDKRLFYVNYFLRPCEVDSRVTLFLERI